ncbi:cytochrome B561 [Roseivivax halodurans JCM 10272]|uniref:Cytochrome B561 n=1 Tax=Roseivivax halodurans JCM 10272 TaxID=1449350 RepID=X7EGL7_9RHOB|nr:cytochrome b [Roseivivax halodurans]ETX14356.1 cytochrome B561 [Roseivivax halodurans JCM 10272]
MATTTARMREGYGRVARLFHWVVAVIVLMMVPAGLIMVQEGLPRPLQNTLFLFHKNVGVILFMLVVLRLIWRWSHPAPPLPADLPGWQVRAAALSHGALYAILLAMPVLGYVRVRAGDFPIEWLDAMGAPMLVPVSKPLAEAASRLHEIGGFVAIGLIALHLGAAIHHAVVRRDGVLGRIWPPV